MRFYRNMFHGQRSMVIFYLLVAYIFISFAWWVLLLIRVTNEAYRERRELLELNFIYRNERDVDFLDSAPVRNLELERKRKVYMIAGEGAVFCLILMVMTVMMSRTLRREVFLMMQQKNFLLSITHELRSPIASAKVAMQTLIRHPELPAEKSATLLNNSLSDMDRLQSLVENLLLAARIEDHTFRIGQDACDLSEITRQVVQKMQSLDSTRRPFELALAPKTVVLGDSTGLTSVITNLVENAMKYSVSDSPIRISLQEDGTHVVLQVADKGWGIPDEEKKRIFTKFYRIGQEETRKTKGTGLGLYIVKKILELHRGSVTVRDNVPAGTVFEVTLPRMA